MDCLFVAGFFLCVSFYVCCIATLDGIRDVIGLFVPLCKKIGTKGTQKSALHDIGGGGKDRLRKELLEQL